jgi:hypothetical protein
MSEENDNVAACKRTRQSQPWEMKLKLISRVSLSMFVLFVTCVLLIDASRKFMHKSFHLRRRLHMGLAEIPNS